MGARERKLVARRGRAWYVLKEYAHLGHSADQEELEDVEEWLQARLPATGEHGGMRVGRSDLTTCRRSSFVDNETRSDDT